MSASQHCTPRRVVVTGASGFVGRALCERLLADGVAVRALVRNAQTRVPSGCERHPVGDLSAASTDWVPALHGVDTVFHLAAVARASTASVWAVNVDATRTLADAAFGQGCRFVYASTIKVHGDTSTVPLTEQAGLQPQDDYGRSKLEAESVLRQRALARGGQWVALRPPIVYGAGDRGNFARLMRLARAGVPLPFAGIQNRRSMIHVDVLVDALCRAATLLHMPNASFMVAGGEALSTPDWLRHIASAAGQRQRLWSLSPAILRTGARLIGAQGLAERLLGSLEVDDTAWRRLAHWQPPFAQEEAIRRTVQARGVR
jgi:nucleoside-diphosphate-sugar epimerase